MSQFSELPETASRNIIGRAQHNRTFLVHTLNMKFFAVLLIAIALVVVVSAAKSSSILGNPQAIDNARKIWGECGACKIAVESLISAGCGAGSGACGPFEPACELICEVGFSASF